MIKKVIRRVNTNKKVETKIYVSRALVKLFGKKFLEIILQEKLKKTQIELIKKEMQLFIVNITIIDVFINMFMC